jgi:3',5'-nucleoside bisphosphate phosphatase
MNLSTTGLKLAAGAAVDLHLHTTYSDGRWTLEPLLDYLLREEFGLAAITDHDRTDTLAVVQQQALEKHLPVLVGIEMTTSWKGEYTDLLCYGFDPQHNALGDLARDLLLRQQENTRQVFEHMQKHGLTFSPEALPSVLAKPSAAQPHAIIACLLIEGYKIDDPAVRKILRGSGITLAASEPAKVVEAAHRSGCVCILAHPGRDDGYVTYDDPLLDEFREESPIDGLEVYHPLNTPARAEIYREYVRRHHLLTSAGSDSHRPDQAPIKYRAELCRGLLERVGIQFR